MRALRAALVAGAIVVAGTSVVPAQDHVPATPLKIGLLLDMTGPYADIGGAGSVVAAQMAVEDFGGTVLGRPVEVISADHQNKPDIAAARAREWFDTQGVAAITDVAASGTALAVVDVGRSKNRPVLIAAAAGGSSRLTNEDCSPVSVHWTHNTRTLANVIVDAVGGGASSDSWYFITADYSFGHSVEADATALVTAAGGKVLGSVRHPLNATDFSSYVLQAQASGAKVVALANAGGDTINAVKAAQEFGLTTSGRQVVAMVMTISEVHGLGLQAAQGMLMSEGFYWDLNDSTRAWSKRFFERHRRMPTSAQAGEYSAVTHYLKAVQAAGTDATDAVMARMRELPVNDMFADNGRVRPDGTMIHPMYLAQVKTPAESRGPWDYLTIKATVPADRAFPPLSASGCPLVGKNQR